MTRPERWLLHRAFPWLLSIDAGVTGVLLAAGGLVLLLTVRPVLLGVLGDVLLVAPAWELRRLMRAAAEQQKGGRQ